MPDEAIYARRATELWQHGSLPLLHGEGAGYGVLYPVVAGFPLATGSFADGYASLKLLQALVVSLAAAPVFFYGRRLVPARYALLAAALTVASPLLLYSGLLMTEVLFYPVAAATLLAIARAVETGRRRDQAVALALLAAAVLTRVQAVALLAVFGLAVLLDALVLAREPARLRRFWPLWVALGAAGAATLAFPGLLGSYAGTLRGSYPLGHALGLVFDHLAYLVLTTGVVPAAALLTLLVTRPDPAVRAVAATTVSAVAVIVVQVGFFAARYAPHLLGRDLAALPPLLFLVFAIWLARGAPRRRPAAALVAFAVLSVLLIAPWNRLATRDALHDSFDVALLEHIGWTPAVAVMAAGIVLLTAFVVLPRRALLVAPAAVLALLVVDSIVASNTIASAVRTARADLVGPTPNWVDRVATGRTAYVYVGEAYWNSVWLETFWNRRIEDVVSIEPAQVPGPIPQIRTALPPSGALPVRDRYLVAIDTVTFVGAPVAHLPQTGLDVSGLTLWKAEGAPRVATITSGVLSNGDMVGPATVDVRDCRAGGKLDLTLLPKASRVVRVLVNGLPVLRADVAGRAVWHAEVPAPRTANGGICRFTIRGDNLLGSTRIAFVRP